MISILIYQDYVHNNGSLWVTLASSYGADAIGFADADDIKNGILSSSIKAFFMPGGASRYVSAKLDGIGNQKIKDYVSAGGVYVGICAGAYYACQRTEWHPGFDQVFSVENELGFFPGIAQGPVPEFISPDDPEHMVAITPLMTIEAEKINSFYWAGPVFKSDAENFQVLACYADLPDQPAAVVAGEFGQGRYLLISPHLEIDSHKLQLMQFDVVDNEHEDIAQLKNISGLSIEYFSNLLNELIN